MTKLKHALIALLTVMLISVSMVTLSSCTDDPNSSIVGTWKTSDKTLTFKKNGDCTYVTYYNGETHTFTGTYSYSGVTLVMDTECKGYGTSRGTYIVQSISSNSLTLLYSDGDIFGIFTKK